MKQKAILLAVVVSLVLAGSVLAMSSTNYTLDWFTPLTSGGGGAASGGALGEPDRLRAAE